MFDCVGIGICAVDNLCLLSHYPVLDEKTEVVDFSFQGGGPVPNALVTLARFGCNTSYIGVVGDDMNGKFTLDSLKKEHVDITGVVVDKNCSTNQAFIWIDRESGKKSIVLNNQNSLQLMPNEVSIKHVTATRYLHTDGRFTNALIKAIELAKEAGAEIVLDAGSPRNGMDKILSLVDYPVVSKTFCHQYLKTKHYQEGLEKLLKRGASAAVVTCGAKGCYGATQDEMIFQPAFNVDVVDTTGAGDVFHGAFIYGLLKNWGLKKILCFASATSALKCMHLGGRVGIPNQKQVNEFLNTMEDLQ